MTLFKSRQVNLDPEPYFHRELLMRHAEPGFGAYYDPRPEFEPTRDPMPWFSDEAEARTNDPERNGFAGPWRWCPRRDQFDTPVNRLLAAIRKDKAEYYPALSMLHLVDEWLYIIDCLPLNNYKIAAGEFTSEEAEHARKVLTRYKEFSS